MSACQQRVVRGSFKNSGPDLAAQRTGHRKTSFSVVVYYRLIISLAVWAKGLGIYQMTSLCVRITTSVVLHFDPPSLAKIFWEFFTPSQIVVFCVWIERVRHGQIFLECGVVKAKDGRQQTQTRLRFRILCDVFRFQVCDLPSVDDRRCQRERRRQRTHGSLLERRRQKLPARAVAKNHHY